MPVGAVRCSIYFRLIHFIRKKGIDAFSLYVSNGVRKSHRRQGPQLHLENVSCRCFHVIYGKERPFHVSTFPLPKRAASGKMLPMPMVEGLESRWLLPWANSCGVMMGNPGGDVRFLRLPNVIMNAQAHWGCVSSSHTNPWSSSLFHTQKKQLSSSPFPNALPL